MILFVDDEARRMDSYVQELKLADHDVVFKSDVDAAFEFFKSHQSEIELIILDIMMPAGDGGTFGDASTEFGLMTGAAFHRRISDHAPNMKTIIFTNVSKESLTQEIVERESVHFCKKDSTFPFELEGKVKELLGQS